MRARAGNHPHILPTISASPSPPRPCLAPPTLPRPCLECHIHREGTQLGLGTLRATICFQRKKLEWGPYRDLNMMHKITQLIKFRHRALPSNARASLKSFLGQQKPCQGSCCLLGEEQGSWDERLHLSHLAWEATARAEPGRSLLSISSVEGTQADWLRLENLNKQINKLLQCWQAVTGEYQIRKSKEKHILWKSPARKRNHLKEIRPVIWKSPQSKTEIINHLDSAKDSVWLTEFYSGAVKLPVCTNLYENNER